MNRPGRRVNGYDHLLGLLFAVSYAALLVATSGDIAMSRDESFYVTASEHYADWYALLFAGDETATDPEVIDRHWNCPRACNPEHPPLAKGLYALSWLAHQKADLFPTDTMAHRFPAFLMSGLLVWLIYIFGARAIGRQAGAFAAVSFALLPRVFYHAHLNAFDVPITLMTTWVTYCYWRSLESRRWGVMTGVAFGLALATKHNSWVLPGIFAIHFAWMALAEWRARRADPERGPKVSLVPWWLLWMVLLGPPILYVLWPRIWNDTWERLAWYASFHLQHEYYNMAYFGRNYFLPPFPVAFPFVMTAFTVSATFLLLALAGLGRRARALLPVGVAARVWKSGRGEPDRYRTDVLFAGCIAAPLLMIALPSSPIFGGTKHWFPAYPFLAMYAGLGYWHLSHVVRLWVGNRVPQARLLVRGLTAALLLAPAGAEAIHSHPFGLSHYGYLAGGVPGSADHGMNRQFWGFTTGSVVPYLKDQMPDGGSVWLCDTTYGAWQMLQRDGLVPENIRAAPNLASADFVLVHHEHHFAEVDFQAWVAFGSPQPAHVLTLDGVPIVSVYENPRRRR